MLAVLKHQQFEDSESDAMEPRLSKCQCTDEYDNKEGQSLNKYESEGDIYVLLSPFP